MPGLDGSDLVSVVRAHAADTPDRTVITWLSGLTEPTEELTYGALDDGAAAVAAALQRRTRPGDRVVLVHPPGLEFVTAFLGCLYAGRVPVPVYPELGGEGLASNRRICRNSGASALLAPADEIGRGAEESLDLPLVPADPAERMVPARPPEPGSLAFLQYTSGSTAAPKGVMITHAALAANVRSIAEAFGHGPGTRVLSWLPVYHDMGLVGNILHSLYVGCRLYLGSPLDFIARPLAWIEAISKYRAETSGGPDFGYALVTRSVERHGLPDGLDLSGWVRAYSGAEQVRPATVERFARALSPAGFRAEALLPCYGLAEATLLVSSVTPGTAVRQGVADGGAGAVSCGPPRGCRVRIAGADGTPLPEGRVGEILVAGPSITGGYWNDEQETSARFAEPPDGSGRWLRTADLGFLRRGELHVTGRISDVLTIRGRNVYPQDIEDLAARGVPELRPGCIAAFGDGADGVVVVAELRAEAAPDGHDRLAAALAAAGGVRLTELVQVPRGAVPKTTSGKLRRGECAERYRRGLYDGHRRRTGGRRTTVASAAATVADLVREAIGYDGELPADTPLTSCGMDSLGAVRLSHGLRERFAVTVPVRMLLDGATVGDLPAKVAGAAPQDRTPASREVGGRTSKAQQALAFLHTLDPGGDEYVIAHAVELPEDVDLRHFRRAVRAAVLRHPELSMRLDWSGGPVRRIPVPREALREALALVPTPVGEQELTDRLTEAAAALPLDEGPLLRLYLWRTPRRTVLQFVVHHVVADLWSLCLLVRDVALCYSALRRGEPPELPPAVPYDAYVAMQERYLSSDAARRRAEELASRLPRRVSALGVRTDRPRSQRRSNRGGRIHGVLPEEAAPLVERFGAVPVLIAVWGLCLHRYGTDSPVVIGVPSAGRPYPELAGVVGLCTNTIPIAVPADPDASLAELVADVRRQLHAGIDAGLFPLSSAVEAVRPERAAGRHPLVETLLTFHENPLPELSGLPGLLGDREGAELRAGDLVLRNVPVPRTSCRYDLDLAVTREGDDYRLTLDYGADLFTPATVRRILATFSAMLSAAAAPDARVGDLFVVSESDRRTLESAGDSPAPPLDGSPVELIRAIAAADPERTAVEDGDRRLTFGRFADLIERFGAQFDRAYRSVGGVAGSNGDAGPDARSVQRQAGLLIASSADFAVAMFAAWRAGLGVLPLLPEFPDQRLAAMLEGCTPRLLVTVGEHRERAARLIAETSPGTRLIVLSGEPAQDAAIPDGCSGQGADPAFTVYTSGSTGRPKGIMVRHRSLSPLIRWFGETFEMGRGSRIAQTLSLAFDFGLQELFTSLPYGACLVVPSPQDRRDARRYARFLRRHRVTVLYTTPSFAEELAATQEPLPDLSVVLLGGELLTASAVRALRRVVPPGCRLFNGYGPTETTVNCLAYEIPADLPDRRLPTTLPVGTATSASSVRVVDADGRPLPVGAVGELLIGGGVVTDGYIDLPDETRQRFVRPAPGTGLRGPVFRSGDLAFLSADTGFVVVGRADRQAKIRGYRVEPAEIEHVLHGHPGVETAIVRVVGSPPRLVAFVVPTNIASTNRVAPDPAELWGGLAAALPAAMIPEQILRIEQVPLTPHAKVDDAELARIAEREYQVKVPSAASPRDIEEVVRRVWGEALGTEPPDPRANVFDNGAHSLIAIPVHRRLETALKMSFPVHYLFEYPRSRDLAARLHHEWVIAKTPKSPV